MSLLIEVCIVIFSILGISSKAAERSDEPQTTKKQPSTQDSKNEAKIKTKRDSGPIPVKIETIISKNLPRSISVVAPLVGRKQADVYAKVTGRISQIGPSEGTKVRAGDTLFKVDRSDPGETFLSAPVVSPIDGWIGRWFVNNIGEQITPSDPVVTIVDDEFLRSTVYLSTTDWVEINNQAKILVSIGETSRNGKIVSIARVADSTSGRGSLIVEVENSDHLWRVGMIARITLELDIRPRMILSTAAINITDEGSYVFVVNSDKASRIQVTYRMIDNDTVEILSGIDEGAKVVIAGGNLLSNGAVVNVIPLDAGGAH